MKPANNGFQTALVLVRKPCTSGIYKTIDKWFSYQVTKPYMNGIEATEAIKILHFIDGTAVY